MHSTDLERNLDEIRDVIATLRAGGTHAKLLISNIVSDLANIPSKYAATIAAIEALGAGTTAFDKAQIARFQSYAAEYSALYGVAQTVQASLASVTEF